MVGIDIPIDLRKQEQFVSSPWYHTCQRLQEGQSRICLRCAHSPTRECVDLCSAESGEKCGGRARVGHAWKISLLLIGVEKEEQLVLDNGSTDIPTELMPLVFRFDR